MTQTKNLRPHMQGRIIQTNYDFITSLDDDWCNYCLSQKHVQMILSIVDYFGWSTRWESASGEIDKQTILELQGGLVEALMGNCCEQTTPILYRVNPENGLDPQISYDGGVTWYSNPANPIYGAPTMSPPVHTGKTKCDAAKDGSDHFNDLIAQQSAKFDVATTAIDFTLQLIGVLLTAVFAPEALPLLIPIFIVTMSALLTFGKTAYDAYWDTDNKNIVFCALVCHIKDDGTFDEAAFNAFLQDFSDLLPPSIAKDTMYRQLKYVGFKGLSNLCSYGTAAATDCSACDCSCPTIYNWTDGNAVVSLDSDCVAHDMTPALSDGVYRLYLGAITAEPIFPTTIGFHLGEHTSVGAETFGYYRLDGTVGYDFAIIPDKIAAVFLEKRSVFTWDAQFQRRP